MIAVGIDPGLAKGAFAAVEIPGGRRKPRFIRSVLYRSPSSEAHETRLRRIRELACGFVVDHGAEVVVVEEVFANLNARASMHLSAARGAIMSGIPEGTRVISVAPSQMKKAVTGSGAAKKDAVARAVIERVTPKLVYPGTRKGQKSFDEFDAIGLALCAAHH